MAARFLRLLKDQSGATAIEYGLICSLIFLAIVTALFTFQTDMNSMFQKISTTVTGTGS